MIQRARRRPTVGKSGRRNRAVLGHVDLLQIRMQRWRGIDSIEERLAECVCGTGTCEPLVQDHRAVGHCLVELLPGRMPMFLPLVRMPSTHRRDPLAVGNALAPRGQRFLNLPDRGRVLEDRVITGTVGEAHAVDVRLDEPRHGRSTLEVDDFGIRGGRRPAAHGDEAAVADRDGVHDGTGGVHGVDAAVDENERLIARHLPPGASRWRCLWKCPAANRSGADRERRAGGGAEKLPTRHARLNFICHSDSPSKNRSRGTARAGRLSHLIAKASAGLQTRPHRSSLGRGRHDVNRSRLPRRPFAKHPRGKVDRRAAAGQMRDGQHDG